MNVVQNQVVEPSKLRMRESHSDFPRLVPLDSAVWWKPKLATILSRAFKSNTAAWKWLATVDLNKKYVYFTCIYCEDG